MMTIKELRLRLGVPQRVIAAALQVDTATVSRWERGTRISRHFIPALAKVLQVDPKELEPFIYRRKLG
ncbi:MAG: helix-turn-helix transcriptional regulator [Firmicutes bacterium]|nr:helix-turn-helix transcriptional regulator [Bacillota bacterium]